jgi:DNA-binding NarL/FixJ family response regulator
VAEPWSEKRVALNLNLSEHTVRNYMIRIFDKLGISSRVELVLYAFSNTEGISGLDSETHFASA